MGEAIRVAAVGDIEDGEAMVISAEVAGTDDDIAVVHSDGAFFAIDDTCTHEDASLADGWIEGTEVECPLHAARFCLKTGDALCLPATVGVKTHRVEVRGDEIFLTPGEPAAQG
ncbi:bifunctional 3-phenylpropionate/cinnamic acid dioxygenase ferredoxin subunit [Mariniluteicoccus flavus]